MSKTGPFTRESGRETRPSPAQKPRRYRRFVLDSRIKVFRAGHPHPVFGRTLGISEAGISALLAADLEAGESVRLEFALPTTSLGLAVRAVARNRSGARYGFEFLSLSEAQRDAITAFRESQTE
ncbi:MAG TPA: PilZ domain-containing protein [Terriglobales bacterium]|nr:PilZ domain-containing protein [Terriglobales bacterium]